MFKKILRVLIFIGVLVLTKGEVKAANLTFNGEDVHFSSSIIIENGTSFVEITDYATMLNYQWKLSDNREEFFLNKGEAQYIINVTKNTIKTLNSEEPLQIKIVQNQIYIAIRQINSVLNLHTAYNFNTESILISTEPIQDIEKLVVKEWTIPTMTLNKTEKIQIPILCYHVISEGMADLLYTPYWKLEDHLKALKGAGFTAITPKQLYEAYYLKTALPVKPILITFDDGYYDNYKYAYPLLKKYDMQATIFIIGSSVKEKDNKDSYGGLDRLSWENIIEMKSHITVQNHTYNSHYKAISPTGKQVGTIATKIKVNGTLETDEEYKARLVNDFQALENVMQEKVGYGSYIFSYPYGEFSASTKKVLEEQRIPLAVTIKTGIAKSSSNPYELPRIAVRGTWSGSQLIKVIQSTK